MRTEPNNVMVKLETAELPASYEVTPFDKRKVPKEGLTFETNVIVTQVKEGTESKFLKRAALSYTLPDWGSWEIMVDEGTTGGGTDTAPSPLGFLSVGIATCLLTHMTEDIHSLGLKVNNVRIEQRIKFHTTFNFSPSFKPEDNFGRTKSLETNILFDADATPEQMQKLVALSEQACFALHAFVNQVPASTKVFVNGELAK